MFEKFYCSPALFLFPPKSFFLLEWFWSFSCGRLSFRIRQPLVVHSYWRLKSTQSDLWVCFEARGQGLSAGEFHWQRPGSVPASSGWDPKWHSLQGFSLSAVTQFPQGRTPAVLLEKSMLVASRGRGCVAEFPPFCDDFSTDFRFPLVPAPNFSPVLCCT